MARGYISEKQLEDIGFNRLANGVLVMVDVFKEEINDIIAATRVKDLDSREPLGGYMFSGLDFTEYMDDIEEVKRILNIRV